MTKIKDASIIILVVFIIVSILYGIHMFRYEFYKSSEGVTVRYDRITNTQCVVSSYPNTADNQYYERVDDVFPRSALIDLLELKESEDLEKYKAMELCYFESYK
tara:strand:+ start:366 stop:677 length:312 start_codon:yes stop_codon:yes gene_type:complete